MLWMLAASTALKKLLMPINKLSSGVYRFFFILLVFWQLPISAQWHITVKGQYPEGSSALPNSALFLNNKGIGLTDLNGQFHLVNAQKGQWLKASFAGFYSDSVQLGIDPSVQFILSPLTINEITIVESADAIRLSKKAAGLVYEISPKELRRAACCNLSESFENNPSIDVAFADAITGTRTIEMLGLSGKYMQTQIELIPFLRGIQIRRGWAYIPGPWVDGLQLSKGIGSVSNGHESISGQLNIELRKPQGEKGNHLNFYVNQAGRIEANYTTAYAINENWSSSSSLHLSANPIAIDRNEDGFFDMPEGHLASLIHRWKFQGTKGWEGQFGFRIVDDLQVAGQTPLDNSNYWKMERQSRSGNGFFKLGKIFTDHPNNSLGIIGDFHYQEQDAQFGSRNLDAVQNGGSLQVLFDHLSTHSSDSWKAGFNFQYDNYLHTFKDFAAQYLGTQQEFTPGFFTEYNWVPSEKWNVLMGVRTDFHNLFGTRVSPRLHLKYNPTENTSLRLSSGSGFRSSLPWLENLELLASSRLFDPNSSLAFFERRLNAEQAWNHGFSIEHNFKWNYRPATIVVDYYFTHFGNRQITDMDEASNIFRFTNLNGRSESHSAMAQLDFEIKRRMSMRLAYKFTDARSQYSSGYLADPYISRHRGFVAWFYETRSAWGFDLSAQWVGPKRLPVTSTGIRTNQSPSFALLNGQIKKTFKEKWEWYLGAENLLGFVQDQPVIDAENPFNSDFDATVVWGPIMGRIVFLGLNVKF